LRSMTPASQSSSTAVPTCPSSSRQACSTPLPRSLGGTGRTSASCRVPSRSRHARKKLRSPLGTAGGSTAGPALRRTGARGNPG
jgi:hypothetical protein